MAPSSHAQYMADNGRRIHREDAFRKGEEAYRAGDYPTAIAHFTEVLAQDPDHLNAYLQRGFCHGLTQNYEHAVKDFTAVIERKADHSWAFISRGSAYNKLGQYDLAKQDFDTVLALDPRNEDAYNNRGWAHKGSGDMIAACQDWRSSQKLGNSEAKIILTNTRCK